MHILHIEDFFHPDAGYQINILPKYMVQQGHQVTVITSEMDKVPASLTAFFGREHIDERDKAYEDAFGVKIVRLPLQCFISGRAVFNGRQLLETIRACRPDVVMVHGNDTYTGMWAVWNRKRLGCPLVLDSHMLEMASVNPLRKAFRLFYRAFFTPVIRRENLTVIRTQDDDYVQRCLGIPLEQAPWISYGSDTMLFHPDADAKRAFRQAHGIPQDAFVAIYAGKLDEAKGGLLLAQLTHAPLHTERQVVFLVVGSASGAYGEEVENLFAASPRRVLRFPTQKYADLPRFYQAADLALFPRQCSLSFYDVQACGLPVLSEDNNINRDRCAYANGWNFRAGDSADFAAKLDEILALPEAEFRAAGEQAIRLIRTDYDYAAKAQEYSAILCTAAKRKNQE